MENAYSPVRFLGVVTAVSNAAMLTVDLNGGADHTGIQSVIDAAGAV